MAQDVQSSTSDQQTYSYEDGPDRQKLLLKAAQEVKGQAIKATIQSKAFLLERHAANILLLKEKSTRPHVKQIILPYRYPPSIVPLKELNKVLIADLQLEVSHRGTYLIAQTITDPYVEGAIITVVEDERGNCARLTVYNQDDALLDSLLPCGLIVVIKEPYCKFNGDDDFVIRVDHPSDLHIRMTEDKIAACFRKDPSQELRNSTQEWKTAGNRAFLAKRYLEAIACYTHAVSEHNHDDKMFVSDVLYRRANVNLIIRRFDAAKEDALASITGDSTPINKKAYICAARAAYELNQFKQCKFYLESALKVDPDNSTLKRDHSRALERMEEQINGNYNFEAITSMLSLENNQLDNASFARNIQVRETPTHGRGLFAARDIEPGEIVMCEKAFYLPNKYGERQDWEDGIFNLMRGDADTRFAAGASLLGGLITKLYNNPSLNAEYLDNYGGDYERSGKEGTVIDGVPVVDVFLVECIRQKNCFSAPLISSIMNPYSNPGSLMPMATGFWIKCAYANHACIPNTIRTFMGTHQIVRASCHIPAGTELTTQYIKPEANLDRRQERFRYGWGFECDCWFCISEKASSLEARQNRSALFEQIHKEAMGNSRPGSVPSSATIRKVEKMTRQLEQLYEPDIYSSLPRLLLIQPGLWLAESYRSRKNYLKMLKYAQSSLRNFGLLDPIWDEKGRLRLDRTMVNIESVRLLNYVSEANAALGNEDLAKRFKEEAKLGYIMITGSEIGIERLEFILSPPIGSKMGPK